MAWKRSSDTAVKRFVEALPDAAAGGRRKMFGYEACFVNGGFWAGMYQDDMVIKLPDALKSATKALDGAANFDPMGGRPMKSWWIIPRKVSESPAALRALLTATFAEVATGNGGGAKKSTKAKAKAPAKKKPAAKKAKR
jgi:hypothetical protein